jgi:hyaluronoglucosaminidase
MPAAVAVALAGLLSGCAGSTSAAAAGPAKAWVTTFSFDTHPGDGVRTFDLPGHQQPTTVTTGSEPTGLATAEHGSRVLVTNRGGNSMSVVDASSGDILSKVGVGLEPEGVAVDDSLGADGTAVVANFGAGTVTPVGLATMRAQPAIPVGRQPDAVAIAAGGTRGAGVALVASFSQGTVTPVDLGSMRAGIPVPVGSEPDAIAVGQSSTGPVALVADFGSDALVPIDLTTMTAGPPIGLPGDPTDIALDGPSATMWVTCGDALVPVSLATLNVEPWATLRGVTEAVAIALPTSRRGAPVGWVAEQSGWVVPVDLARLSVGSGTYAGGRPNAVVLTGTPASA